MGLEHCLSGKNVVLLEDFIASDDDKAAYDYTESFARINLFSRYAHRRRFAAESLDDLWECETSLVTQPVDGEVHVYLRLSEAEDKYLFIKAYPSDYVLEEVPPDAEELGEWPDVVN